MTAEDVCDFLASPDMKAQLDGHSVSHQSAIRFFKDQAWRYSTLKKEMYRDGHEDSEVVKYWKDF